MRNWHHVSALVVVITVILSFVILPVGPLLSLARLGFAEHAGSLLHHPLRVAEVGVEFLFIGPSSALGAELCIVVTAGILSPPVSKEVVDLCLLEIGRVLILKLF